MIREEKKSPHLSLPYSNPQKVLKQETEEETSLRLPQFLLSLFLFRRPRYSKVSEASLANRLSTKTNESFFSSCTHKKKTSDPSSLFVLKRRDFKGLR